MTLQNTRNIIVWLGFQILLCTRLRHAQNFDKPKIFFCDNGTQFQIEAFCNGIQDCKDGSDEITTPLSCIGCQNYEASCNLSARRRTCLIHRDYICNGSVTCQAGAQCDAGCPTHYRCQSQACKERNTLCNGNSCDGCSEDDDWATGIGFQCVRRGKYCRLPQQLLRDGVADCEQGADLCYSSALHMQEGRDLRSLPSTKFNHSLCFMCLDHSMIVPRHKVCDGVIDCSDLSDECLCEEERLPDICNYVKTRTSSLDYPLSSELNACKIGQVSCGNGICINRTSVCDSTSDCPDNRDEKFSYCQGTMQCRSGLAVDIGGRCRCDASCLTFSATLCDGVGDCPPPRTSLEAITSWANPPGFPDDECVVNCPKNVDNALNCTVPTPHAISRNAYFTFECLKQTLIPVRSLSARPTLPSRGNNPAISRSYLTGKAKCNGSVECNFDRGDELNCNDRFYCPAGILINIPRSSICNGIVDCDDRSDEMEANCSETRFFCPSLNGALISIPIENKCNFILNCDDNTDEINCTEDGRFYCENKSPLYVTRRQVFDGRGDCSDLSDECPTNSKMRNEDPFASRYHLIANSILRVIVWIMGLLAILGNGIVIVAETLQLQKKESALTRANRMLVLNLAIADSLMGVYLIILGIVQAVYSGVYCANELQWLGSSTCGAMGVLVVLSSETSVITLAILTSVRLFAVLKPFSTSSKPTQKHVLLAIFLAWTSSLLLALIPFSTFLQYLYTDRAMIVNNPFFQNAIVQFSSARRWTEKLLTFDATYSSLPDSVILEIKQANSWSDLQQILGYANNSPQSLEISRYYGYYSANSVCIPRLFVTREDNSWRFSLAITIFNFLAFTYVACAYVCIIFHTRKKMNKPNIRTNVSEARNKKTKEMENRILRLVATDFCCWVPISIMAFINFSGVPVSLEAYAVSAIVLLPINSALNPILYSNFIKALQEKLKVRLTIATSAQEHPRNVDTFKVTKDTKL